MMQFENFWKNFGYEKNNPLLFNSGTFLLLFTVFIFLYALVYKKKSLRTIYVILFSLYFYYKTSGEFVLVLLVSIAVNFFLAVAIEGNSRKIFGKVLLWAGILANIGLLSYFKYTNFLIENLNYFFEGKFHQMDLIMPIGISFFTFQTLSYLIDVQRETIKPTRNILDYAFYISFFPYIVAGPIVRAKDLIPQNTNQVNITDDDIGTGLFLIMKGLIKKAILAQYFAQYCDIIYGMPGNYSGFENLIAMYGYTMQIYLDFSGYSDMAIGIARIMGFKLKDNFNEPYKSVSVTEFWRRWHISLSTWLRDYLFLPLTYFYLRHSKNNKTSLLLSYIWATMLTMLIAGLWHGASYKYVFWGGAFGLGLVINRLFLSTTKKKFQKKYMPAWLGWLITFNFVSLLWIFFRAGTFQEAIISIQTIVFNMDLAFLVPFINARLLFSILFAIGFILVFLPTSFKKQVQSAFTGMPIVVKAFIFVLIVQFIIQLQSENVQPFIYFQF
jgi:D-alanyl-lipoteichoic acid acyltransferase DltB (MBOAT superfamily)